MKQLNKMFASIALLASLSLLSLNAGAALITQEVKVGGETWFSMLVNVDEELYVDLGGDLSFYDNVFYPEAATLLDFRFFGETVEHVYQFEFGVDLTNPMSGFSFLNFDVDTGVSGIQAAFSYDTAQDPFFDMLTISTPDGNGGFTNEYFFGDEVTFNVVPEPSLLSTFALGFAMLMFGRRKMIS